MVFARIQVPGPIASTVILFAMLALNARVALLMIAVVASSTRNDRRFLH